jgi:pilus assembly protein CpaF
MEAGTIQLQDIFRYRRQGINEEGKVTGQFKSTGFIPSFYEELAEFGQHLDTSLYAHNTDENGI